MKWALIWMALSREWGNESLYHHIQFHSLAPLKGQPVIAGLLTSNVSNGILCGKPFRFQTSTTPQGVVVFFLCHGVDSNTCVDCVFTNLDNVTLNCEGRNSHSQNALVKQLEVMNKKTLQRATSSQYMKTKKIVFEIVGVTSPKPGHVGSFLSLGDQKKQPEF